MTRRDRVGQVVVWGHNPASNLEGGQPSARELHSWGGGLSGSQLGLMRGRISRPIRPAFLSLATKRRCKGKQSDQLVPNGPNLSNFNILFMAALGIYMLPSSRAGNMSIMPAQLKPSCHQIGETYPAGWPTPRTPPCDCIGVVPRVFPRVTSSWQTCHNIRNCLSSSRLLASATARSSRSSHHSQLFCLSTGSPSWYVGTSST